MRTLSSSVMAMLVIAALFWGNCFSCPQMFQSLHQSGPSHGCCPHSKKNSQDCSTQSLRNFVKADPATHDAPAATPIVATVAPGPAFLAEQRPLPVSAAHTPPDLLSLHASFRI